MLLGFCLVTTKIWSDGHLGPPWRVTALRSRTDRVIALKQISVTALFFLDNSRKIHLRGIRACRPKDMKRRAPQHAGAGGRERASERVLAPRFICFSHWAYPM